MEYNEQKRYNLTKGIFTKNFEEIKSLVKKSKYVNTAKALFRFAQKIDKIATNINKTDDLYVTKILLRSLLEHEIVAYYIWAKYIEDENDDCGTHYYVDYSVAEQLKREGYNLNVEGIEKGIEKNQNLENLKLKLPLLQEATQKDLDKVYKVANQFDIKRIAKYLNTEISESSAFSEVNQKVILDSLIKYNLLSSYIHGGATAELETFENDKSENSAKALKSIKNFGLIGSRFIMEQLIMFLADEHPKYVELIKQITSYK